MAMSVVVSNLKLTLRVLGRDQKVRQLRVFTVDLYQELSEAMGEVNGVLLTTTQLFREKLLVYAGS